MLNGWPRIHRQVALGVRLASLFPNQLDFSMESGTPKVWFSGAHAPNRNMQGALSLPSRGPKFQNKFLEGLRGDIHNQVEKTNAQWMASDPSSSCIRGPTGLLYRFACQLSALSLDAQWMAPSSSCIRSPTGQSSMESETHKVWFSGAHAPNRNAKSPFSPKSEAQVSKQILGRSSGRHPQSS